MGRQQECSNSLGILEEFAHGYLPALRPGTDVRLPDGEDRERLQTSTRLLILSNSSGLMVPASISALAREISSVGLAVATLRI